MALKKGTHKLITCKKEVWEELTRIKYQRQFQTLNDVIEDLLKDEIIEVKTNNEEEF